MKKYRVRISEERHSRDLESIGSIFMPIMKGIMAAEDLIAVDIVLNWREIIGKEISSYSWPVTAKFNPRDNCRTLQINVPVGGFALEIQHKERYILDKINAYFGYQAVHKLKINQSINMTLKIMPPEKRPRRDIKLPVADEAYLVEIASGIKDEKLREILIKLGKNVILSKKE